MFWATTPTLVLGLILSAATTLVIMLRAERLGLIQQVNQRSSHDRPTPTGGGIGIVGGVVIAGLLPAMQEPALSIVLLLALITAAMGAVDDRWPLPAKLRLAAQAVLIVAMVVLPTGLLPEEDSWIVGTLVAVLGIWWINLFNFMDGIDGLAGSEALFILTGAMLLLAANDVAPTTPFFLLVGVTATATAGFLIFNWPPAKIFMGDAGSTFLAFLILAFGFYGHSTGFLTWPQWIILAALFISDASTTLATRILARENVMEAHKQHAYQKLMRRWGSHRKVTLLCLGANVTVLLPAAWLAGVYPQLSWGLAVIILAVLSAAAARLGAGTPD